MYDGKIEAEVKLTGILSLGALVPGESRKYGTTIAPCLYAPIHQHFFVARMDMTVDCKPNEAHNQVTGIIYMPLNIKFQFSVCKKNFTISLSTPNLTILGLENIT